MMSFLQSVNLYKKVKRELVQEISDASWTGALISILSIILVIWLIYSEVTGFLQVEATSRLVVNQFQEKADRVQMILNVDFPKLKCDYVNLKTTNFMGTRAAGMAPRVNMYHLDRDGTLMAEHMPVANRAKKEKDEADPPAEEAPKEPPSETAVVPLSAANFDYVHRTNPGGLFVVFCVKEESNCKALEASWEKTAAALKKEAPPGPPFQLGRVNCDEEDAQPVCAVNEVDVYPTIAVFRFDAKGLTRHETYHGTQSSTAMTKWVRTVLFQNKAGPDARRVDVDKDGSLESHEGIGCRVAGTVHVQNGPGILHFLALAEGKTFDAARLNMAHKINHLAFGHSLTTKERKFLPPELDSSWAALSGHNFGADKTGDQPTTYEHTVKLVRHRVQATPTWNINGYAYVAHSAEITPPVDQAPSVRISYDILPFTVMVERKKESLPTFLTQLCGIVGGTLAVASLIASLLNRLGSLFESMGTELP